MPESNQLGRFIKDCRTSLGYTSRKVEELTRGRPGLSPISHSNLLAIEKGSHVPTFDKILTLSLVFNIATRHFEERLREDMLGEGKAAPASSHAALAEAASEALAEGQHARALELFVQAHAAALADPPSLERAARLAETRLQAANCRKRLGLLRVAKDDLEELLGSEETPGTVALRASFLLAEVHRDLRNHRLALLHAKAALDLATDMGERALRARILNTVANILDDRGDAKSAIAYYQEAMQVFTELGDRRAVGLISRNLGEVQLGLGDAVAAVAALDEGIRIARDTGDRRGLAYGLANLARAQLLRGDADRAKDCARQAKQIAQSESYPDVLFVSLFYLWKLATQEGESSLARVYADRLGALHRKLETRCAESEEWARHVASSRRTRA